jgi:hypothetical protein
MEDSPIDALPESEDSSPAASGLVTVGAIVAVLLGIWCVPIGIYGVVGIVTGKKMVAGLLGALWGYMAVVGTYELLRRKFDRDRGRKYGDQHLLAGTVAVAAGLMISGAVHETMPALAILPALAAIKLANHEHEGKSRSWIHIFVLLTGIAVGVWFHIDGVVGGVILERIAAMP